MIQFFIALVCAIAILAVAFVITGYTIDFIDNVAFKIRMAIINNRYKKRIGK